MTLPRKSADRTILYVGTFKKRAHNRKKTCRHRTKMSFRHNSLPEGNKGRRTSAIKFLVFRDKPIDNVPIICQIVELERMK